MGLEEPRPLVGRVRQRRPVDLCSCWSVTDLQSRRRLQQSSSLRARELLGRLRQLFGPSQAYEQRATIILLSHRLSAFPQADMVVLNDGQIVEQGTHAELSEAQGLYARIYRAQRQQESGA